MPFECPPAPGPDRILSGRDPEFALMLREALRAGQSLRLTAFHGTTHQFPAFAITELAHVGGAFGRMHYFSTSWSDARWNYACVGPDLENRIEEVADQAISDPTYFGLDPSLDNDALFAAGEKKARAFLVGKTPQVLTCELDIRAPFVLDRFADKGRVDPPLFDMDAERETLIEDFRRANDVTEDAELHDLEDRLQDAYFEQVEDPLHEAFFARLVAAFEVAATGCGLDAAPDIPQAIQEDGIEISHRVFHDAMTSDADIAFQEGPEGLCGAEFTSRVIAALGFDAILLLDANRVFSSMVIEGEAVHVHIPAGCEGNISILHRDPC